jgi:hypothetical protein
MSNPIDESYDKFCKIIEEKKNYEDTVETEQDTRLKIIDRILTESLGWDYKNISTEPSTIDGYIDYVLSSEGLSKVIVEAKRAEFTFDFAKRPSGSSYILNGAVFHEDSLKQGIAQAIRYCGQKNTELACVTNGEEWLIFRGSRLGDGTDTMLGKGIVFSSLEGVKEHFSLFYDLLHFESVPKYAYRSIFQEEEGRAIRYNSFKKTLIPIEKNYIKERHKLGNDIDKIMNQYFKRLTGDGEPEMLEKCFVVTKESELAEKKIARISESLILSMRKLETESSEALRRLIKMVHDTKKNAFILLVGTKGAGKSTFVSRFFKYVLPKGLADDCITMRVNVGNSSGDEGSLVGWLNREFLSEAEKAIFGSSHPDYEEIQGMFFDEYRRWAKGPYKHMYENDKNAFKIEFGKHIEKKE